jgi:hypothetical protein
MAKEKKPIYDYYLDAKSKIGASEYRKNFGGREGFRKAEKARDEADAEVKRETKGASGTESLDAKREREAYDEFRRESRGLEKPFDRLGDGTDYRSGYKKGGKVKSASARADGIAIRGKTRA